MLCPSVSQLLPVQSSLLLSLLFPLVCVGYGLSYSIFSLLISLHESLPNQNIKPDIQLRPKKIQHIGTQSQKSIQPELVTAWECS